MPSFSPSVTTARTATRSASSSTSPNSFDGYEWIQPTPNPSPLGRSRSDSNNGYAWPPRTTTSPFSSSPSTNSSTIALVRRRLRERGVQVAVEVFERPQLEQPALPTGVGRFSTAGKPTVSAAGPASRRTRTAANRGCGTPPSARRRRIATLWVIRCAVAEPIPGRPELLRHRRHDRHCPVCGDRQHAVDAGRTRNRDHRLDLREIDHVRVVGMRQPNRLRIAVDRDDPQPELLGPQDRAPLMAARTDEKDALHGAGSVVGEAADAPPRIGSPFGLTRRTMLQPHREQERHPVPARDLAPVQPLNAATRAARETAHARPPPADHRRSASTPWREQPGECVARRTRQPGTRRDPPRQRSAHRPAPQRPDPRRVSAAVDQTPTVSCADGVPESAKATRATSTP